MMEFAPAPERTLPHALDAEQALLGAILHHNEAIDRARDHVGPEDFFDGVHRQIFEAMIVRRDAGDLIDLGLMRSVLGDVDIGSLTVGQYLVNLMKGATTISGAPSYARLISQAAQMRVVMETAQAAVLRMSEGVVENPAEYAAHMIEALDGVATSGLAANMKRVRLGTSANAVLERVNDARAGRVQRGAPFGLPALDRATLGMRDGQLAILAGRPGMGKTTAAIHIGLAAARVDYGVHFISLEMNAEELAERVLSAIAYDRREPDYITYRAISEGVRITDAGFRRLEAAKAFCDGLPLEIEQQPGLTVSQIAARARQMALRFEREGRFLGLLIIDHIGLIRPSKRYSGNRVQEVAEITTALKAMTKELGIPILALSQLNREVEKRSDKRPMLADLRDSGSIEQDADLVIALFREAYYLEHKVDLSMEEQDRLSSCRDTLEIEILKQRGGPTLRIECFCDIACNILAEKV